MTKIDTHVHFWKLSRGDYSWLSEQRSILYHDFGPENFLEVSVDCNVRGCVAVQAAPTTDETNYLLGLASETDWILGVTGWVDLKSSNVEKQLEQFLSHPKAVAIRPMSGVICGPEWLSTPEYLNGLKVLSKSRLALEALALPHHLPGILKIARQFPELKIIINHAAKPKPSDLSQWNLAIGEFRNLENVICKFSGLTQQSVELEHHRKVFDSLLKVFGPNRLIWGSDFPVLLETSSYVHWCNKCDEILDGLSDTETAQIECYTAIRTYGLNV